MVYAYGYRESALRDRSHLCLCRHPTSCCSAAEIMSTLFFYAMKYKVDAPRDPANDRFVLSKVSLVNIRIIFMF